MAVHHTPARPRAVRLPRPQPPSVGRLRPADRHLPPARGGSRAVRLHVREHQPHLVEVVHRHSTSVPAGQVPCRVISEVDKGPTRRPGDLEANAVGASQLDRRRGPADTPAGALESKRQGAKWRIADAVVRGGGRRPAHAPVRRQALGRQLRGVRQSKPRWTMGLRLVTTTGDQLDRSAGERDARRGNAACRAGAR